ncbi:MAG: molecular chaperone HtpG, partial [Bacteroidetes bacterium]|nr:molecular chaperone HtpG [Bacteroidota bacterium]
ALQADGNVKKISSYVIRKVADKLFDLFKKDRKEFETKWNDIDVFVKYGMLTEDKFYEKSTNFFLLQDVDEKFYTIEEYKELVKVNQENKDKDQVWLYASDKDEQYTYMEAARKREFNVLYMNEVIDAHFLNLLEQKLEKTRIKRIDAGSVDELIDKGEEKESVLSKENQDSIIELFKSVVNDDKIIVKAEPHSPDDAAVVITEDEFMRRMGEMSKLGGGMPGMGAMPSMYNLVVNSNHSLAKKIVDTAEEDEKIKIVGQLVDLARLSKNILKGKDLNDFIERTMKFI